MTVAAQTDELLKQCEKLLREADNEVEWANRTLSGVGKAKVKKRRNAINAACNALFRASRA